MWWLRTGVTMSLQRYGIASALATGLMAGAIVAAGDNDPVWLVGGGPNVYESQLQIEANVLWARSVLQGLPGKRTIRIWFDDGDDPAPDVTEWSPPAETPDTLQPLARVLDSYWSNGEHYRNHRIPGEVRSTEVTRLSADLETALHALRPAQTAWLIFNGHGALQDDRNNTIELWNDTALHVNELVQLLRATPAETRLRFLFTQCYSGAFTRLAEPGSDRCGFVAEVADREAEGCSAAVDKHGWQDYSTHFFAALAGRQRDGSPLPQDPDLDGDGRVSPLEAHYYTLVVADSADIPRATSEALLEDWQPWYLGITTLTVPPDNPYTRLAQGLMRQAGLTTDKERRARMEGLKGKQHRLEQARIQIKEQTDRLRQAMEQDLVHRWPRLGEAYTMNYKHFLEQDLDAAQAYILAQPRYAELKGLQDRSWEWEGQLLNNERAATRLDKIDHLLSLARARAALERFGPADLRVRYEQLLECESAPF